MERLNENTSFALKIYLLNDYIKGSHAKRLSSSLASLAAAASHGMYAFPGP
jgi:hypothetical protein